VHVFLFLLVRFFVLFFFEYWAWAIERIER
jgi:hypothetical protein